MKYNQAKYREVYLIANKIANKNSNWKRLNIYPKEILDNPLNSFTADDKKRLTAKGLRWYVYFSYKNPKTGKFEKHYPSFPINSDYPEFDDRYRHIIALYKATKALLMDGFSPYVDADGEYKVTVNKAFKEALAIKKKEVKATTYGDYANRMENLERFLSKKHINYVADIEKSHIFEFLNSYSAKNSNNFKSAISSVFSVLSDQDLIKVNFVKELRNKVERKKSVRTYSDKEVENISGILRGNDPQLDIFIKMVSYLFFRPIELVELKKENIDFKNNLILLDTKQKDGKTKIIPELFRDELYEFVKHRTGFLFSPHDNGKWDIPTQDKRKYYTLRFSRFRNKYNIDADFKIYGFRYTYITKLYLKLREELSIEDTIKKLSLITGHSSKAIFKYIQVNDIELPEDYSDLLK
ncbi:hypothetical protein QO206_13450 [Leeuwenhoekiella aequorea]|uniref:tyrosine-type recombinase/integrase n=1 Tax=Leeuwenhoekiella aequorea TaxID=283736 RepID=UPI00352CFC4A|tara:strand:- start:5519 stop:6748 length:1230 start_codon:yes stop_codon:yes gene_type:complete